MNLSYTISNDRRTLTVFAFPDARAEIQELEFPDSDDAMYDTFEELTCNSELEWVFPEETGDLTSAPMLGILDNDKERGDDGHILERWAFMDYQVESVLGRLLRTGSAVFTS